LGNVAHVHGYQQNRRTKLCRRCRRLASGMTGSNYNYIVFIKQTKNVSRGTMATSLIE
jgi:hypothetical protein